MTESNSTPPSKKHKSAHGAINIQTQANVQAMAPKEARRRMCALLKSELTDNFASELDKRLILLSKQENKEASCHKDLRGGT